MSLFPFVRRFLPVLSLAGVFLLAGCSTPHVVKLKDGRELITKGAPDYDRESGFYDFTTVDGRTMELNKDLVESIHRQEK